MEWRREKEGKGKGVAREVRGKGGKWREMGVFRTAGEGQIGEYEDGHTVEQQVLIVRVNSLV